MLLKDFDVKRSRSPIIKQLNTNVMKKSIILCTMVTVCFFIWTACQKEQSTTKVADVTQDDVTPKIKAFSERLKFASTPNTEINARDAAYSAADAAWNLEALINHLYGHPSEFCESEFKSENKTIIVPKVNGQISDAALLVAYTEMWTNQRDFYSGVIETSKHVAFVDVELTEDNAANVRLNVTTYVGLGELGEVNLTPSYDWIYWKNLGTCDGSNKTSDASKEINKIVNGKLINVNSTMSFVYSSIEKRDIRPPGTILDNGGNNIGTINLNNPADIAPNDNKRDYLLYYSRGALPNHTSCVPAADIPWYAHNIQNLIIPIVTVPTGKAIFKVNCYGDLIPLSNSSTFLHRVQLFYGIKTSKGSVKVNPNIFVYGG